ncbi:MAG: N-acetyltransferase [Glaciihabitans sp.]|nr:N-acetyltransferase [Glaciihabitans sp.]
MNRLPNSVYSADSQLSNGLWAMTCRLSDDHPDGSTVEHPDPARPLFWRTLESAEGLVRVEFAEFVTPEAPPVWFVYVDEPMANPPAAILVAYANDRMPAGTVISKHRFPTLGIHSNEQVAAVRWYPADGLIHQLYVTEKWRRQQLGTRILYAAGAFHIANRWNGKLHADGRRTDLGERFVAAAQKPERAAPLTETMPPMD